MQLRAAVLLALLPSLGGVALAQEDPDEPTPVEPPPVVYVPVAPAPQPILVPAAPPPKKEKGGAVVRLEAGAVYRYALKESFAAAAVHLLAGGEKGALGFAGVLDLELGQSRAGLFYSTLDWGFEFFGRVGERLRLGIGPHFGLMIIQRATNNDPGQDLVGFMFGLTGDVTIDVVRFKRGGALLIFGRIGYEFVDPGRLYSYASGADAQLGLGIRL